METEAMPDRWTRQLAGLVLMLSLLIVAASVVSGQPDTSADARAASDGRQAVPPVDPFVDAVSKVRSSVVAVGTYNATDTPSVQYAGTGFVIGDGWYVATNQHVVQAIRAKDRLARLQIFFPDRKPTDGRNAAVVLEDPHHDVAILRFDGAPGWPLDLDEREPQQGETVGVVGYPIGLQLGLVPAAHRGVVAAVVPSVLPLPKGAKLTPELIEAIRRPYNLFQLDMVVYPGNSGSPLFDGQTGQVVGIINKTLATRTREHLLSKPSGISYAVPVRWVRELLEKAQRDAAR